jgi:hypothetical protein
MLRFLPSTSGTPFHCRSWPPVSCRRGGWRGGLPHGLGQDVAATGIIVRPE